MGLPFAEETYTVSQLGEELKHFVSQAFASVWVMGELQRVRASRRGHLYFELVEKGAADEIVGRLDGVLWRTDHARVRRLLAGHGLELADEQQIRCRARLDFYPPGGRLQLIVEEVDPLFTEGLLARRRRETLAALAAAGLLERNRELALPALPLDIGLVTSHGSAAYHDFLSGLEASGYGFRVVFVDAATQGSGAEEQIASALRGLGRLGLDCVALVRGGGARSDLAVFDSRAVAEAIATAPVPVLTGLGHQIDQAIADIVAHRSVKTPTMVAELLVERVAEAEDRLLDLREGLARESRERVRREADRLVRVLRAIQVGRLRLAGAAARLDEASRRLGRGAAARLAAVGTALAGLRRRLAGAAPRLPTRSRREPERLAGRLLAASRGRLREARRALDGRARLCRSLGPERTLERGFSITRARGRALRRADQVGPGERVETQLATGRFTSRVEG